MERLSTGMEGLDELLGGGLLPGTLTAVVGSTGIGKTQFGLQFAHAGLEQEGHPRHPLRHVLRGDSQNHADYARRMFGWELRPVDPEQHLDLERFFSPALPRGDYLHVFDQHGRRVTRADLDFDAWHQWQAELGRRLNASIAFFYGNFVARRAAGGGRRNRAGRPPQRLDPIRAVRLHLPSDSAERPGVGRPRPVPRALSAERRGHRPNTSTNPAASAACCWSRRRRRRSTA